jgi:hypothetical protein
MAAEAPVFLCTVIEDFLTEAIGETIEEATDSVKRGKSTFVDECLGNRGIFEHENIEIHALSVADEFVERGRGVFRLVVLPEKSLELALQLCPIVGLVSVEQFNDILRFWGTVIWDSDAFLGVGETKILAFDVPATKKFRDVRIVKVQSARLPRAWHDRAIHAWRNRSGWRGRVDAASAVGVRISHC